MTNEITDFLNDNIGREAVELFGTAIELTPYIGSVLKSRKLNRLNRRLEENTDILIEIQKCMSMTDLSFEYYSEKIGPLFIEELLNEHEDAKILYLLKGYKNIFIDELQYESLVFQYFDLLRELRYSDIRRLFYHAGKEEIYPQQGNLSDTQYKVFVQGLDEKLDRYSLINIPLTFGGDVSDVVGVSEVQRITEFGKEFIHFIR